MNIFCCQDVWSRLTNRVIVKKVTRFQLAILSITTQRGFYLAISAHVLQTEQISDVTIMIWFNWHNQDEETWESIIFSPYCLVLTNLFLVFYQDEEIKVTSIICEKPSINNLYEECVIGVCGGLLSIVVTWAV